MHLRPTQLLPIGPREAMNPQVRLRFTFDREYPNQHDQPLWIAYRSSPFPLSLQLGKMGLSQKGQKVRAGLLNPLLGNHASSLAWRHRTSFSPSSDNTLP